MRRECREHFPRHRLQRKPLVSDPAMHHGTFVTHVPWCMSRSPTRGGGKNGTGIPGACTTRNCTYLARGPWNNSNVQSVITVRRRTRQEQETNGLPTSQLFSNIGHKYMLRDMSYETARWLLMDWFLHGGRTSATILMTYCGRCVSGVRRSNDNLFSPKWDCWVTVGRSLPGTYFSDAFTIVIQMSMWNGISFSQEIFLIKF